MYAVTPELSGNADWEAALARMQKNLPLQACMSKAAPCSTVISRQAVFYADEAAFNDPSSLFLCFAGHRRLPRRRIRLCAVPGAAGGLQRAGQRAGRQCGAACAAGVYARRDTGGILSGGRCGRLHLSLLCDGHVRPGAGAAAERHTRGEPRPGRNLRRAGGRGRGQQCVYPHTGRNQRLCDCEPARARRRRERRRNGGPPRRHCGSGAGHACAHPKLDRQPAV